MFWDGIFIDYFNLASKSIEEVAKLGKGFWKLPSNETKLPIPIPSRKKVKNPEMEFFDINLTKGSSLLLHAIHSPFNFTEKDADIMCYQITMRTCTVAIYQTPRFKMLSPESGGAN
jgi:hypothetical protein